MKTHVLLAFVTLLLSVVFFILYLSDKFTYNLTLLLGVFMILWYIVLRDIVSSQ